MKIVTKESRTGSMTHHENIDSHRNKFMKIKLINKINELKSICLAKDEIILT